MNTYKFSGRALPTLSCLLTVMAAVGCAKSSTISTAGPGPGPGIVPNAPAPDDSSLVTQVSQHLKGRVAQTPWAGYWWPYADNGTADADAKYEQAVGTSGAADWERANHGANVAGAQDWWGHCNGWSAAAVLFPEPRAAAVFNGVTFTVADQKALLTEVATEVNGDFFGHREDDPNDLASLTFQDILPDQFFLVLTNIVGTGRPLIIDRYTGVEVWNQPLVGYQITPPVPSDYLGAAPGAPGVYRLLFSVQIWWARDDVDPNQVSEPFTFSDGPSYESRTLRGELWLDGPAQFDASGRLMDAGNVILTHQGDYVLGGQWHNGPTETADSHPDYMWIPYSIKASSGYSNPGIDPARLTQLLGIPLPG